MFDPTRNVIECATRVEAARLLLSDLSSHTERMAPKERQFIEDMATRMVLTSKDVLVTERQLEWMMQLCNRYAGGLPDGV